MVCNFGDWYLVLKYLLLRASAVLFPRQTTEKSRCCLFVDCFIVGTVDTFTIYTGGSPVSWRVSTVNHILIFHVKMLHEVPLSRRYILNSSA